jgi:hypothetical protein
VGKGQGEHGPEDEDLHKSHIIPAWEHCRTQEYKLIEHDTPQSLLLTCPALWMLIEYSIHLCEKLSEICSMADDCLGSVPHRKGLELQLLLLFRKRQATIIWLLLQIFDEVCRRIWRLLKRWRCASRILSQTSPDIRFCFKLL